MTGAARGIGKAIALQFAKEGANVAFTDLAIDENGKATEAEIAALGVKCKGYASNAADFEQTHEVVKRIVEEFGRIDILVNNAGITNDKLILRMSKDDFTKVIDTNLVGAFNFTKYAAVHMSRKKSGRIINLSSVSGVRGNAGQANYSASKAGIIGLTLSNAKELGRRNITVNAIAPGFIDTEMTMALSEKQREAALGQISMGRYGSVQDVAKLAAFLASDDASYITGQVIGVDGGIIM